MDWLKIIILGIVQGLTEFLPISSSGHLVLTEKIFNLHPENIFLEVFLHFGTFCAVVIIFRKDIWGMIKTVWQNLICNKKQDNSSSDYLSLFYSLLIGTLPALVLGLTFKGFVENSFKNTSLTSLMLILTGIFLFLTRFSRAKRVTVGIFDSLIIGLAQGLALLPGISRSGWTIGAGLFRGIKGTRAAEFSFLLSLPAILGASSLKLKESISQNFPFEIIELYILGSFFAFIFGYMAIRFLLQILKKGKLEFFGYYCMLLGILSVIFLR